MSRAPSHPPATCDLSFEDYLALPESMTRQEVIDGVIVKSPTPSFWHQQVLGEILYRFRNYLDPLGTGRAFVAPLDVLIRKVPKLRTRQPDILYLGNAKLTGLDLKRTYILETAPDLVIEIRPPSDRPKVWAEKLADYASIGIREVWRIDPEAETIEVLELANGVYVGSGV